MAFDTGTTVNDRVVFSETLTLANADTASGATIDFVPPGSDFTAFINTGALDTSAVTTDLQGSHDGTTWADIDASFAADCDTAMIVATHDASAAGDFPYYRLQFDSAGDDSLITTFTYKIAIG